jgi:hypothetical protein
MCGLFAWLHSVGACWLCFFGIVSSHLEVLLQSQAFIVKHNKGTDGVIGGHSCVLQGPMHGLLSWLHCIGACWRGSFGIVSLQCCGLTLKVQLQSSQEFIAKHMSVHLSHWRICLCASRMNVWIACLAALCWGMLAGSFGIESSHYGNTVAKQPSIHCQA